MMMRISEASVKGMGIPALLMWMGAFVRSDELMQPMDITIFQDKTNSMCQGFLI